MFKDCGRLGSGPSTIAGVGLGDEAPPGHIARVVFSSRRADSVMTRSPTSIYPWSAPQVPRRIKVTGVDAVGRLDDGDGGGRGADAGGHDRDRDVLIDAGIGEKLPVFAAHIHPVSRRAMARARSGSPQVRI